LRQPRQHPVRGFRPGLRLIEQYAGRLSPPLAPHQLRAGPAGDSTGVHLFTGRRAVGDREGQFCWHRRNLLARPRPREPTCAAPAGRGRDPAGADRLAAPGSARRGSPRPDPRRAGAETLAKTYWCNAQGARWRCCRTAILTCLRARSWVGTARQVPFKSAALCLQKTSARSSAATSPSTPQADRLRPSGYPGRSETRFHAGRLALRQRILGRTCSPRPCGNSMDANKSTVSLGSSTQRKAPRGDVLVVAPAPATTSTRAGRTARLAAELPALAEVVRLLPIHRNISNSRRPRRPLSANVRVRRDATTLTEAASDLPLESWLNRLPCPTGSPQGGRARAVLRGLQRGRRLPPTTGGARLTTARRNSSADRTMNAVPLYFNKLHARRWARGAAVHPLLVMNVVFGMTVEDLLRAGHRGTSAVNMTFPRWVYPGTRLISKSECARQRREREQASGIRPRPYHGRTRRGEESASSAGSWQEARGTRSRSRCRSPIPTGGALTGSTSSSRERPRLADRGVLPVAS